MINVAFCINRKKQTFKNTVSENRKPYGKKWIKLVCTQENLQTDEKSKC